MFEIMCEVGFLGILSFFILICLKLCAKLLFQVFKAFQALSRIKQFKLGVFCMKLDTQLYLIYIIVMKWLQLKNIVICLNYMLSCVFKVCKALLTVSRIKQFKLGLFCLRLGTQHYMIYIVFLKWLELIKIVLRFKLRVQLRS